MSTTALSNIQEVIENSIFEIIRNELVDKGYLPNITDYPDTPAGVISYNNDLKAITVSKDFAIEIFNQSSNFHKGIKAVPRIVIKSGNFLAGSLGGDPKRFFEDNTTNYLAKVTPPQTSDFYLDIHCVSQTSKQERVLNSLLSLAVPKRSYIKWYNDSTKTFFIRFLSFHELDNLGQGLNEKVFSYEIPDCWDMEDIILPGTVSKINQITMDVRVQKYINGTWDDSSDTGTLINV